MIGYLKGIIVVIEQAHLVLDVNQVGYLVYCGEKYCVSSRIGDEKVFFIETVIRENDMSLYGFATLEEKQWFRLLGKVQGVGAKMAMMLLAQFNGNELAKIIMAQDTKSLTLAHGVGGKLAQRIINELHDKLPDKLLGTIKIFDDKNVSSVKESDEFATALAGLIQLGFSRQQSYESLLLVSEEQEDMQADDLLKFALRNLSS